MAKKKYKKKPEVYYAIQYDGTNNAEMTAFCSECVYDTNQGKLLFRGSITVNPTDWIMQDNAGMFTLMIDEQFNAYFDLAP